MRVSLPPPWALAAVGLAGGFFSALFGVGGGIVVVPLLVLLLAFDPREATGTSLVAIGFTALFGALAFGALGEVDWVKALVVGVPAMVGTLVGTWLQQRVPVRTLKILLALLLVAVAVRLLVA